VRTEEKQVEGNAVEHEVGLETLHDGAEQEQLPAVGGEELRDVDRADGTTLVDAMRQILSKDPLNILQLALPARELRALDALQQAVTGKTDTGMFVFAEDRKSMLEQALAVLQPNLTASGQTSELAEMSDSLEQLTKRVASLRQKLTNLEDAQDELMADEKDRFLAEAAESDDKPAKPSDPDAPRPASTIKGPGPEVEWKEKPITVDKGPEAKREEHVSTLSKGAEVKREERPTTLGDPKEIAAATPWWHRKKTDAGG
jgi:hypothetical protein